MNYPADIFVIPVLDQYMVYSPLNGKYALLNQSGVLLLRDAFLNKLSQPLSAEFSELVHILKEPGLKNPEKTGALNPHFLGIIISRRCNMSCAYCDFGAHSASEASLDPEMMVAAIDWFAAYMEGNGYKTLPIQFFGGEPFVENELLDIAVHHARLVGSRTGLIPHFEVLSNGYFGEQQRIFIKDYFDRIIISLDGFQKYQDRTRSASNNRSSFEQVVETVNYLSNHNIELALRCCITSESVHDMEAMAHWFCQKFDPAKVNFETLTKNPQTKTAKLTPPDPYIFAEHCLKSWRILREYGVEPAYAPIALDHPQTTSCPVGRDVVIVHPDGMIASCYVQKKDWQEKGMDLSVGRIHKNGRVDIDVERLKSFRNLLKNKPRCTDCFCRYGCAGGCHVNNTFPDSSANYTDYCVHTRIMTICRLLEEMQMNEMADELLSDKNALDRMVHFPSDKLSQFEG